MFPTPTTRRSARSCRICRTSLLISDALGQSVKLRVSTHGLRSVEHVGGLDNWLLKTSEDKLSPKVRKLKREIVKKATDSRPLEASAKLTEVSRIFLNAGCTRRSASIARELRICPAFGGVFPFSPPRLETDEFPRVA